MKIERNVDMKTGVTKDRVTLTPEEDAAMETAHEIIKARAAAEKAAYDEEKVEWCLLGLLRAEGVEKMLERAKTAPFQRRLPKYQTGYSYSFA